MNVVPFAAAPVYEAPGHERMTMRRLQGREAGPSDTAWLGLSVIEPGGGTTPGTAGVEKFYVVLDGELQVRAVEDGRASVATLRALDSCRIAPGESRELHNPGPGPCTVLLVMPNG